MGVMLTSGERRAGDWSFGPMTPRSSERSVKDEMDRLLDGAQQMGLQMTDLAFVLDQETLRRFHAEREPALSDFSTDFLLVLPMNEYRDVPFAVAEFG